MSKTTNAIPPRIEALMIDAATQGLSPQDEAELQAALAADPHLYAENDAYACAATAIELSFNKQPVEDLPQALREKLIANAATAVTAPPPLALTNTAADKPATAQGFSLTDGRMFGWYAAIAALLALAFVLAVEPTGPAGPTTGPEAMTLAQQYDALANDAKTITAAWGFNADGGDEAYANATGQVIWNADEQTGYMKLAGLPVNDPTKTQYQLWIVDPARDAEPIDGGVFDITATGETIVPIDAKLRSNSPTIFAITVEHPGGVVVSEGPLQVVAAVAKS